MTVDGAHQVVELLKAAGVDLVFPVFVSWYLLSRVAPLLIKLQRSIDVLLVVVKSERLNGDGSEG